MGSKDNNFTKRSQSRRVQLGRMIGWPWVFPVEENTSVLSGTNSKSLHTSTGGEGSESPLDFGSQNCRAVKKVHGEARTAALWADLTAQWAGIISQSMK